jgi:hypothetical protein
LTLASAFVPLFHQATTVGAVSMHGGAPTGTGVAPAIPEGQCGLYTKGDGQLALCVESVLRWGELIQVRLAG